MKRSILIALMCMACDQEQSELTSAYEEAVVQTRSSETISEVSAPRELGAPPDPLAFIGDLESFIAEASACAQIEQSGDVISVDFGEEGCDYLDRTLTGAFEAVVSEDGESTVILAELFDLSDGIVTLSGTASAQLSEEHRQIDSDLHISHEAGADPACDKGSEGEAPEGEPSEEAMEGEPPEGEMGRPRPPAEVDMIGSRTETPLEGDFANGVVVNGSRQMSAEEGEGSMSESALEIRTGEIVPQAGTITHDGPRGAVVISFSRVSDEIIEVSVEGERGSEVFEVDPATGARL